MSKNADLFFCPKCNKNIRLQTCSTCGGKGKPVYLPFERDLSKDPSYFEHIIKKRKTIDSDDKE